MEHEYETDSAHPSHDPHDDRRSVAVVRLDAIARRYTTYDHFLKDQITETDMYYLEDRGIARTVKELSFHGNSDQISREQFTEKKAEQAVIKKIEEFKSSAKYLHTDRDVFLLELARREEANLSGRLVTIIYLRDRNAKGQEISSYIDFAQRLHEDDFTSIFAGRSRLTPKMTDLSHYNWDTNIAHHNNTPNVDIIFHGPSGIQFKCKKDRRFIFVDPNRKIKNPNVEDTTRRLLRSKHYAQVVLFDHFIRFWAKDDDPNLESNLEPISSQAEPKLDLYDNVTAAIFEDDIMEIAINALSGNLHHNQHSEWAPADVAVAINKEQVGSIEKKTASTGSSFEWSILGTIKNLYNAHKTDVSFGTLGNFTFIQMIEQLGRLLPDSIRQKTEHEIIRIATATADSASYNPEKLPPIFADVDELIEKNTKNKPRTADASLTEDQKEANFERGKVSKGHFGQTPSSGSKKKSAISLGPAAHISVIKNIHPDDRQSSSSVSSSTPANTIPQDNKQDDGLTTTQSGRVQLEIEQDKYSFFKGKYDGFKDSMQYSKQLETRMNNIFQGKAKKRSGFWTGISQDQQASSRH